MQRQKNGSTTQRTRGFALPVALMLLFVMVVLVGALMGIVSQELREVSYTGYDNRGLYLADAGIQEMVSQEEIQNPALAVSPPQYYYPADSNGLQPSFVVSILNHNLINNRRTYLMQSEGITSEGYTRYVDALSLENTFANYNYAGWSNAPGNYFVAGLMQYNGPVYLGGGSSDPVNIWWQDGAASIFLSNATVEGSLAWSTSGGSNAPVTQTDWTSIDSHGSSYFQQTSTPISFPPDADGQVIANEALTGLPGSGSMPSVSNGNGVYVNGVEARSGTAGTLYTGLYVNGNANLTFASSTLSANPQTETITVSPVSSSELPSGDSSNTVPYTTTVTVNYTANTTTVVEHNTTTVYTGVPSGGGTSDTSASANGAIWVNGNVDSLSGTVHGDQTIAVGDNNQNTLENNIVISGDINYQSDPQTCGCASTDMLGIIGHNVEVSSNAPSDLTIEAAVFAGNSYDYAHNDGVGTFETQSNVFGIALKGPLLVYGSLVNASISPLGVFNGSTGQLSGGWGDSYTWDTRYQTSSPPFYPSDAAYTIIGWTDCGSNPCS
jgi:Tfp pilus assembly protein PilX